MFKYVLVINTAFLIFRVLYVLLYPIDLSPEEAQYWDWSRHPDISYYSKPPMVAYMNFISTSILGNTEIGVRINAILLSFLLSLITYFFVKRIFDERVALISSTFPNLFVGYAINSVIFTTDSPLIFFWALSVICFYFAVEKNELKLWLLTGFLGGLAFLSKYSAVFLLPSGILYILLVKPSLLKDLKIYTSLVVAFILSLPVLIWNLERNFVSFKHVSSLATKSGSFPNFASFGEFLGGQILLLSFLPFFFILLGWYKSLKAKDNRLLFLTIFSFPIFLFFLVLSLKKRVYANWAGFGYYTAGILFAYYFLKTPRYLKITALILSAFLTLLVQFSPIIDYLGLKNILPPNRDPTKVLIGWEDLGKAVSKYYTGDELIFSTVYQISAEMAFYVKGNPRTYVFHIGRYTQYYFWREGIKEFKGKDAIFVNYGGVPKEVLRSFSDKELLEEVKVLWRGKEVRRFYIFRLKDFKGEFYEAPKGY
ncbi:MAG TPA: glycosyltransferase family 39 protein [Aquificaceae bacterium]|nr:glycosyltransferase family 39 protein [Aquificaceae bacterium]